MNTIKKMMVAAIAAVFGLFGLTTLADQVVSEDAKVFAFGNYVQLNVPGVDHAQYEISTNGVPMTSGGTSDGEFYVPADAAPVTVTYTPAPGWKFSPEKEKWEKSYGGDNLKEDVVTLHKEEVLAAISEIVPGPMEYFAWDETEKRLVSLTCESYQVVTAETTTFENGWYVVMPGDVVQRAGSVRVTGDAHLILAAGSSYEVTNTVDDHNECAAIAVEAEGAVTNSLSIYGVAENGDGGMLMAVGMTDGAGIGGGPTKCGGIVAIHGGAILCDAVTRSIYNDGSDSDDIGNTTGAGIGGGGGADFVAIDIYGGHVDCLAGYGAGIGSGRGNGDFTNSTGVVNIYGGTVTARAVSGGAGIGGGKGVDGCFVNVFGGTVEAEGTLFYEGHIVSEDVGAGIGGGGNANGGVVNIAGGNVTAKGNAGSAGIGGGTVVDGSVDRYAGGSVTISGAAMVVAYSVPFEVGGGKETSGEKGAGTAVVVGSGIGGALNVGEGVLGDPGSFTFLPTGDGQVRAGTSPATAHVVDPAAFAGWTQNCYVRVGPPGFVTVQPFAVRYKDERFFVYPENGTDLAEGEVWVSIPLPDSRRNEQYDHSSKEAESLCWTCEDEFYSIIYGFVAGEMPVREGERTTKVFEAFGKRTGVSALVSEAAESFACNGESPAAICLCKCRVENGEYKVLTIGVASGLMALRDKTAAPDAQRTNELAEAVETTYCAWNSETRKIDGPYAVRAMPITVNGPTTLRCGMWYVVQKDDKFGVVNLETLTVDGEAHLILEDGSDLVLSPSAPDEPGLRLLTPMSYEDSISAISIYGQQAGTGRLTVNGTGMAAGIGTGYQEYGVGTVNIHGGLIEAHGGENGGAAIGTGAQAWDGYSAGFGPFAVNVYGGSVQAQGGTEYGPGIGFGRYSEMPHCAVTVLGGDVTAWGAQTEYARSSAIGWGNDCAVDSSSSDPLALTLGRGMALWTGVDKDSGEDTDRTTAADYDFRVSVLGETLTYAHIKPAPVTTVEVLSEVHSSFVVYTNGVEMTGIDGRQNQMLSLPGVIEVEVVYTADDGYLIEEKLTWSRFIGADEIAMNSEFHIWAPPSNEGTYDPNSRIKPIQFEAVRTVAAWSESEGEPITLTLQNETPAENEGYFWVAFRRQVGDWSQEKQDISDNRMKFRDECGRFVDQPVGWVEERLGGSVYTHFANTADFDAETGSITDLSNLTEQLPFNTVEVFVFKVRGSGQDAQVVAVGGNSHIEFNQGTWGNELFGETISLAYWAWDEAQGKVVQQSPVKAIVLKPEDDGREVVLHGNKWYAVVGSRGPASLRVDVGTAHLILADGCQLHTWRGVSVDDDAKLAIYSTSQPKMSNNGNQGYASLSSDVSGEATVSGGTLEIHGGVVVADRNFADGEMIDNARTTLYAGRLNASSTAMGASIIRSGTLDVFGGELEGRALGNEGAYPAAVIAGERDGARCTLNVHVGGIVRLVNEGLDDKHAYGIYRTVADDLDVRLDDGVYTWAGAGNGTKGSDENLQLTTLPIYRARPKSNLLFCSGAQKVSVQDFAITAVYDESLKTNGYTLKFPEGDLKPGEKWVVFGFDEATAREEREIRHQTINFTEYVRLGYAQVVAGQAVAGTGAFIGDLLNGDLLEIQSDLVLRMSFQRMGTEDTVTIPAENKVDMLIVGRVYDTEEMPLVTFGLGAYLQSLANGETAGNALEFISKQEFSVSRDEGGNLTLTMPEGELKAGESWTWATFPTGVGDNDMALSMMLSELQGQMPVGALTFDMLAMEFGKHANGSGTTTDGTIPLPEGTAAVLVGKTFAGVSQMGPSANVYRTLGVATYLNNAERGAWPRHDELFPSDSGTCLMTILPNDKVAFVVSADGNEIPYSPDGVYALAKGSDVRVQVLLLDTARYQLRSPSVLVYDDVQLDFTVGAWDVVVVERGEPGPVTDQGFLVTRGEDGSLTIDMSGEEPLQPGEMWVWMSLDKTGCDMPDIANDGVSFGDIVWRDCIDEVWDEQAGELPLDMYMLVPGAEALDVTTNSVFAIPADTEFVMVARAYDGNDGESILSRYYALSFGGARWLSDLKPGETAEGERWHEPHDVRYSAWDGEKVVHGLVTNAAPILLESFDITGTLQVTEDACYTITCGMEGGDRRRLSIDVAAGVTLSIIVKDGARLDLDHIHLPPTATLNVYGQDNGSGKLSVFCFDCSSSAGIGGNAGEGCGTINVYGGKVKFENVNSKLTSGVGIGSGAGAVEANGTLNVYHGLVEVLTRNPLIGKLVGIGGAKPMGVNVYGGKIVVMNGRIGDSAGTSSGLNLGAGYKLMTGSDILSATAELPVYHYEKLLPGGDEPNCVRVVRPATLSFDAGIAALVNGGKLQVMVRRVNENWDVQEDFSVDGPAAILTPTWTDDGGTCPIECGDDVLVAYLVTGGESLRRPDVMAYRCVEGDVSVTLDDLKWHEPELVAEQDFAAFRVLDGRIRLTMRGTLAEGEKWLWIALPDTIANMAYPLGENMTIGKLFLERVKNFAAAGTFYVGGKRDDGGNLVFEPQIRPVHNCFEAAPMGIPFLPGDGFHWGVSNEKSVFYTPSDTEVVMVFKVYDAGIAQEIVEQSKAPSKKALKGSKGSGLGGDGEILMMAGDRFMAVTAGAKASLQDLPHLPEGVPGDVLNPWPLGPDGAGEPYAYTNGTETLVIDGEGPYAQPTKRPWLDEGVGPITRIEIKNPRTELPDDIFEGLGTPEAPLPLDLPDNWEGDFPEEGEPLPPWHGGYVKIETGHWPLTIRNVKFQQRYPWNGLVDITFDLTGSTNVELGVAAKAGQAEIAASGFVGRDGMMFEVEGRQDSVTVVWDAAKDALKDGLTKLVLADAKVAVGAGAKVGGVSAAGLLDLVNGSRIARDVENIVVDPKWGAAERADVLWPKAAAARPYAAATVDKWNTAGLLAGKYEFAYTAGGTDYAATFWVPADSWTVFDHETITGERPVTGPKVLVVGESVIKPGEKLVIEGNPEFIWDGGFKVEEGGKILAPGFDVVVDPETGLVTLVPKAKPTVTGLKFAQRYPWNGLVDVSFTANYEKDPSAKLWVKLAAKLNGEEKVVKTLYVAGDMVHANTQFQVAQGEVHLVWDTMKDIGLENFGDLEITVLVSLTRMAEGDQPVEPPAGESKLLCLTARGGSVNVSLCGELFALDYVPDLEYSRDGKTWEKYAFDPKDKPPLIAISENESVYFRGNNPNGWNPPDLAERADKLGFDSYADVAVKFTIEATAPKATAEASGSVMSLIDGTGEATEIPDKYCFCRLFDGCTCLTKAPDLTATMLKSRCYKDMFDNTNVQRIRMLGIDGDNLENIFEGFFPGLPESGTFVLNSDLKGKLPLSVYLGWQIVFDGDEPVTPGGDEPSGDAPAPLCFTAKDKDSIFWISYAGSEPLDLQFSTDGKKWGGCKFGPDAQLNSNVIYVRGLNPKGLTTSSKFPVQFVLKGKWDVSGDVMSLIDYTKKVAAIPCSYCFCGLFGGAEITSAPELSATVLAPHCYESMFEGCASLKSGPALPAETIPEAAYLMMFANCTALSSIAFGGCNLDKPGDGLKSWLDYVGPSGQIIMIGKGRQDLLTKEMAVPEGWTITDNRK